MLSLDHITGECLAEDAKEITNKTTQQGGRSLLIKARSYRIPALKLIV